MGKYKIYHIPDYVYKDGSVGKIGVSCNLNRRIRSNNKSSFRPFKFWEILEEHDDIIKVSHREIELQKKYTYTVDTILYCDFVNSTNQSKGGYAQSLKDKMKGLNKVTSEQKSKAGVIGGRSRASSITFEELSNAGKGNRNLKDYQVNWLRDQYKRKVDLFGEKITYVRLKNLIPMGYTAIANIITYRTYTEV